MVLRQEGTQSSQRQMERLQMLKDNRAGTFNFGIPSNNETTQNAGREHGEDSWRFKVVEFIHSGWVQKLLMSLLVLDVLLLFLEFFLLASYPHCTTVERDAVSCCPLANYTEEHRWLASEDHSDDGHHSICATSYEEYGKAACDEHKWSTVHVIEDVIFSFTIAILTLFIIELNFMMVALGPGEFFRHFFFALDYIIVTVSLVLEAVFYSLSDDIYRSFAGMLVLVRVWRFVRIGHGIVEVTHELAHEEYHKLEHYKDTLVELLKENDIAFPEFEGGSTRNEILSAVHHKHHSRHDSNEEDVNASSSA